MGLNKHQTASKSRKSEISQLYYKTASERFLK